MRVKLLIDHVRQSQLRILQQHKQGAIQTYENVNSSSTMTIMMVHFSARKCK